MSTFDRCLMEDRMNAKVITFTDREGVEHPGGMCSCCGGGPEPAPSWRPMPWLIYRAGICDSDGVYYPMLCEGCLEEIRTANLKRRRTQRDEQAAVVTELLDDDLDGAQAMMEDLDA